MLFLDLLTSTAVLPIALLELLKMLRHMRRKLDRGLLPEFIAAINAAKHAAAEAAQHLWNNSSMELHFHP
jgi:hypothetical protein